MCFTGLFVLLALIPTVLAVKPESATATVSSSPPFIMDMVYPNPGEPAPKTEFLNPELLKRWGFNGNVPREFVQCAITYDSLDKGIFPVGSEERKWVENNARQTDQIIAAMKAQGLPCYPFTDFIVLPRVMIEKYKTEICDPEGHIDIHRPKTQEIVRVMVDEIFRRFPDLGGITLRHGETYLHDTPYHAGGNPILHGPDSHVELLKLLREEICVKRNKVLFYRTWDFGNMHDKSEYYLSVTDQVEPHPKLFFSIKHQLGDFHRLSCFNPCLGIGKHRQIVEVCCQLDSYGKGAYPYYNGQGVLDGWEEYAGQAGMHGLRELAKNPLYAGTWTWSRGGGWSGPFITNEFWCELNTYVCARWAQNPERTEEDAFNEFAHKIAGIKDAQNLSRFRKIALLSASGTLRSENSLIQKLDVWWNRDQFFDACLMSGLQQVVKDGKMDAFLAEKATSTAMWQEIEKLGSELQVPDPKLAKFIRISCTYGRIKCEIIEQMCTVALLGLTGDAEHSYDKARIKAALATYDRLWEEWRALRTANPDDCATLYETGGFNCGLVNKGAKQNPGMGDIMAKYRALTK